LQILAIAWAMAVVCALQPIPNRGAGIRGDLFSVALGVAPTGAAALGFV
jgi:energy-converting hydrogenase Eha subunit H